MGSQLKSSKRCRCTFLSYGCTAFNQFSDGLLQPLNQFIANPNKTAKDYDIEDFPAGFLNATNFPGGPGSNYYCIPMSFESIHYFSIIKN